jgi:protein-S-isoprenylcysteine O-methyltransferase Ste14
MKSAPVMMGKVINDEVILIKALWVLLAVLWLALAFRTKRTVERRGATVGVALVAYLAIVITNSYWHASWIHRLLWARSPWVGAIAVLLTGGGTVVAVWARVALGRNWSGVVTLKEDHQLIQSGPYRFVRHPIYSGILLMAVGSVLLYGEAYGIVLLAFIGVVFGYKIRVEERLMSQQFPSQYLEYRRRVKAIVPFLL